MAMVCPRCSRSFEQQLNCPLCGSRLLFQANTAGVSSEPSGTEDFPQWQQTPWGRLAIGFILSQGLAYGLQQILTAGMLATGEQSSIWTTLWGIVLLHGIQGGCLLIGGALCGAGKRRGILYGSFLGLVNGLIFLFTQRQGDGTPTAIALYGQPILHMAFGAFGGLIGMLIWKPLPAIQVPEGAGTAKIAALPAPTFGFLDGPIYLGRVCLGIFVVVNGIVWSNAVLSWVMQASQGALEIRTHLQSQLISWEVCGLATLVGAGLAGANTFNGLKQGLCVGIGSSLILAGVQLGNAKAVLETTILMILGVMVMTIVGGWFGSQLFPPIQARKRRNRILTG
jgi:hypothetical protein